MDLPPGSCNNKPMSKVILLELNEKEAEVLKNAILKERHWWDSEEADTVNKERMKEKILALCLSIDTKLDNAQQVQPDSIITSKDLHNIKSLAKDEYVKLSSTLQISNKAVEQKDFVHISLTSALILWLNRNNLLKRLVKFDITDDRYEYEEMD